MNLNNLMSRVDELIQLGNDVLATRKQYQHGLESINEAKNRGFRSASLSFIERIYGNKHPHYQEFNDSTNGGVPRCTEAGISILSVIKGELAGGWLFTVKGLVAAEVLADFLEMAEHLLSQGYKDPSAVLIGSVLEEHLRQLCQKHLIDIKIDHNGTAKPKKADRLNGDLTKRDVYNKLNQKSVTTWLDLRNKAADGRYSEYTDDQVQLMLQGVTDFMCRVAL
jgi:hypothetical protein